MTAAAATPLVRAHWLVLAGPAALLSGALAFQHLGGLPPCEMCLWQRWPHVAALALATVALALPTARRPLVLLAALAVLVSAGLGLFHAGVEQQWWAGVTECAATSIAGDFQNAMLGAPVVRCDAIPWSLAGISLAGWNAIVSLALAAAAMTLAVRARAHP